MHFRFRSLVTAFVLAASCAQASVTLHLSNPVNGGIASGFSTQTGVTGVDGLKWGIIVDTSGDGFAGSGGGAYAPMASGPGTAALMVLGAAATDDYFVPAATVTADYSVFKESDGTTPGGKGTIGEITVPYGANGIVAGKAFAIIWFNSSTTGSGDYYGIMTDASFVIPTDGFDSLHDTVFLGADSPRNATTRFLTVTPPEIAVYNGSGTGGTERTDNAGAFDFGTVIVGESSATSQTFTIQNKGTTALTGIAVTKTLTGSPGDFTVDTTGMSTSLAQDATTSFTVTFSPTMGGARTAVLAIASNDADENPFEIRVNGVGQGLALASGMAVGPDDPATALTVQHGSTVRYSVRVAASVVTSQQVVVWLPVPAPSDVNFPVTPVNISLGGVYTASGASVSGATVPANSVYWVLDDITVAAGAQVLSFDIVLSDSVLDATAYTTVASAHTSSQASVTDTPLLLTIGNPNLPPQNGTIQVSTQIVAFKTRVTVNFSNWTDPEGNTPLSYGVHRLEGGGLETVAVTDAPAAAAIFDLPADPAIFNYVARVKDSFGHVTVIPFTVLAPEIAVMQPALTDIADGGSVNFGDVGTGVSQSLVFTIKNNGTAPLTGLAITKDFTHAAMFTITANPVAPVAPGGSTTFTVKFTPTGTGAKVAKLHIASNDADESPYDITLNGNATATSLPTAVTGIADPVSFTSATLNGTVNAKGSMRDITFEYGLTTSYGSTVTATPATLDTDTDTPVSAVVTGLLPHKTYNYRVKASGALGAATGAKQTFTTGNHGPSAADDSFGVVAGNKTALPVLANDGDADGDTLTITATGPLSLPAAGTLVKTGNALFFTAASTFTGAATASFTYTISDGFGQTATATVTLTAGAFTLNPPNSPVVPEPFGLLSAAGYYDITVDDTADANGLWLATENLPWVTLSTGSGIGDGTVRVTYQANATKTERHGSIVIGGITHNISQPGVTTPALHQPDPGLLTAIVGDFYSLTIPTDGAPVTYKVTPSLPAGLKLDNATGIISGIPTKGSTTAYTLTVSASNAAGSAPDSITFDLTVLPIPAAAVGAFQGYVERDPDLNGNLGSRLEFTTTSLGACTGKLITGGTTTTLKGVLKTFPADQYHPTLTLTFTPKGLSTQTLELDIDGSDSATGDFADGTLSDTHSHSAAVSAWRSTWSATNKAPNQLHTFSIEQTDTSASLPQGIGYGSFTAKDTTGALTVSGKLADGSAFSTVTFLAKDGRILIYQPLYGNLGSFAGILKRNPADSSLAPASEETISWFKPAPLPNSKDTVYLDGFGPLDLTVEGAAYTPPGPGALVMGLTPPLVVGDDNAYISFADGGVPPGCGMGLLVSNPSVSGLTNKATFKTGLTNNPYTVTMTTLTAATGAFTGTFTIPGASAALNRKVTYYGQIVKHSGVTRGYGFFLLPASTAATAPKLSGSVILDAP